MAMIEDGVRLAVNAYWRKDPYFPRSTKMWREFKARYLEVSGSILGMEWNSMGLPGSFVELMETGAQPV